MFQNGRGDGYGIYVRHSALCKGAVRNISFYEEWYKNQHQRFTSLFVARSSKDAWQWKALFVFTGVTNHVLMQSEFHSEDIFSLQSNIGRIRIFVNIINSTSRELRRVSDLVNLWQHANQRANIALRLPHYCITALLSFSGWGNIEVKMIFPKMGHNVINTGSPLFHGGWTQDIDLSSIYKRCIKSSKTF